MDSNSEDGEYQHLEHYLQQDAAQYRVTYPRGRDTQDMDSDQKEEFNIKKYPVSRSGNNPGRVKRVVSCKRKTHHLTVTRRKQLGIGKMYDAANKENEMKCMPDMDSCEFPLKNNNNPKTGTTGTEQADYCSLTELTRDHSTMTDVLFGRNLRLKVSLTLWRRNVGELLTYFLRIEDIAVFVDFLPLISKRYLIVGLKWIHSVLKNWWGDLETSGYSGSTKHPMDKNFQAFNQQLAELWHQEPFLKSVPGPAGDLAKVIDSFLSQLT
ncbi:KATNB1-like protein 1 isoform X2 [Cyclopterus lumpus]|uniref:KATNB1-like protein 1 isoform X2 n=1 Tax=Cyclopterus lumpus TaxID=8103 RepID=UPI001487360E|nr:KATNB1-like protein 1 isoform X2 [Cyclopterus lumpus]